MTLLQTYKTAYDRVQRLASMQLNSECLLCHVATRVETQLCESCWEALPRVQNACIQCGVPLLVENARCGTCVSGKTVIDKAYIPFIYDGDVRQRIIDLKYHANLSNAYLLSEWMWRRWRLDNFAIPDAILPMPLHVDRIRERGFNQSVELARLFARRWQSPLLYDEVIRHKDTQKQTGLSLPKRIRNVRGAFSIKSALDYQHVAIFDDVITTGATLNSLAKLLKQHHVSKVSVIAVARAITL